MSETISDSQPPRLHKPLPQWPKCAPMIRRLGACNRFRVGGRRDCNALSPESQEEATHVPWHRPSTLLSPCVYGYDARTKCQSNMGLRVVAPSGWDGRAGEGARNIFVWHTTAPIPSSDRKPPSASSWSCRTASGLQESVTLLWVRAALGLRALTIS